MGRPRRSPKGATAIPVYLNKAMLLGLHQLRGRLYEEGDRMPDRNELILDAIREYLKRNKVDLPELERRLAKPRQKASGAVLRFPDRPKH